MIKEIEKCEETVRWYNFFKLLAKECDAYSISKESYHTMLMNMLDNGIKTMEDKINAYKTESN